MREEDLLVVNADAPAGHLTRVPSRARLRGVTAEEAYDARPWLQHYPDDVPSTVDPARAVASQLLDDAVASYPDNGAVTFARRTLTYRALDAEVGRLAGLLAGLEVGIGDRVALVLPNCPQHVIALFATWRLGAVAVEANPLATEDELRSQLAATKATAVICLDHNLATVSAARSDTDVKQVVVASLLDYYPLARRLALLVPLPEIRSQRAVIAAPVPPGTDVVRWRDALRKVTPLAGKIAVDPADVAVIHFTGGTVSDAQPVELTHANLVAHAHQLRAWFPDARDGREVTLGVLPLFHAFGLVPGLLLTVLLGGRLVVLPRFDTDQLLGLIAREQPSYLPGIPPMYRSLLASQRVQTHDLRSLRRCLSIGARLPTESIERFERLTGARLVEAYGLTEATAITHAQPTRGARRPGAMGLPLPGTDARIVDTRDPDRVLEVGERGELAVRGPQVRDIGDDWLLTGDLAVMDDEGWFTFVERTADVVTRGLSKVVPADIERLLFDLPGVEDCSVVGAVISRRTTITAYVVRATGAALDEDAVRTYLTEHLPAKQVPTRIEFRDVLPRSIVGHTRRRDLASPPPTPRSETSSSEHPPEPSQSDEQSSPASPDSP